MAKDLLLEIGTEEIPAKFMPGALAQLESIAKNKLDAARVRYQEVRTVGTPRRMALIVRQLDEQQADQRSENRGPSLKIAYDANGQPTKAAAGFARSQGVDISSLVAKDGYVYAIVEQKGGPVSELLPELLTDVINSLSFPKNMRWADFDMRFVRPIRWLVALFGTEVIPFTIAGVTTGKTTRGHRFLSKGDINIESVEEYFAKLAENHVMVDQDVRRRVIREQIERLAAQQGGTASIDEDLLEEVVYLVEYPTALCGKFEDKYLKLPAEVVITPMREHQRYFPVFGRDGKLLSVFITVRNGGSDYIDIVRHGNERVLRARLADAEFFYLEDQKVPLAARVDKLKTIVFQEGLGTLYDKTLRLERLAAVIAEQIGVRGAELELVERSAHLSKADLVTGMVYEFTELQGVMGREYARLSGEPEVVSQAIFEHYLPRFAGDILPESPAGRAVGIADKLDNIVATFSRGLIPTGSQDPYALRRQALGIVNILVNAKYHLSLEHLVNVTMDLLGIHEVDRRVKLQNDIQEFFRLRIKNLLTEENMRHDMIDAVMAAGTDDVYDVWLRAKAMALEGGTIRVQRAVQAFTRAGNLAKNAADDRVDAALFTTDAERNLYQAYSAAKTKIDQLSQVRDYVGVLKVMAEMAEPIDDFFGAVMVMAEDQAVRRNRLALLKAITGLTACMADLSKIV